MCIRDSFTFFKHRDVSILPLCISVPAVWICCLLPLSVFDPDTSVGLILDWESSLGNSLISMLNLALHKVRIILLSLEPELESILTLAGAW